MNIVNMTAANVASVNKQSVKEKQQKNEEKKSSEVVREITKNYTNRQLYSAVLAATIGSAAVVGGIMHGRNSQIVKRIQGEMENSINALKDRNSQLIRQGEELTEKNKALQERLNSAIEASYTPEETQIYNELKQKIADTKLEYDFNSPPVVGKKDYTVNKNGLKYPETHTATSIRSNIQEVNVPKITNEGRFEYELPSGSEIKITKVEPKEFEAMPKTSTSISESYADSVQWDNDKISRDLIQNFYDGHCQTLDGVKFKFEPLQNGIYKVRIEGKSTYAPDKAVFIGESTKRNDPNAAGNYGEGIKMASLKLLRDKGAKNVKIGSNNWQVNYSLENNNLSDKRVLSYSMEKTPVYDGNYIEFETEDKNLLEALRTTIGRFYSSSNAHFKCPDFENKFFGFKKLKEGEKGGLYISGQRFEFNGNYDGLDKIAFFIKQKPPVKVLDPSRDRTSINESQLEQIASWLADYCTTAQEKLQVMKALEEYGIKTDSKTPINKFLIRFVNWTKYSQQSLNNVQFPENYVAYSNCSRDILYNLRSNGYKVFDEVYGNVGMRTIHDVVGEARKHNPIEPNTVQKEKIILLKEALKKLAPAIEGKHFTKAELDTKIYLFDRKAANESRTNKGTLAEAITESGTSKGFWIDKAYLDESKFAEVLETSLHELSHKAGGDGTSEFGYKLTDVNQEVIKQIINNPRTKTELSALNRMWEDLQVSVAA